MKPFDREAIERAAFFVRRNVIHTVATNGEGHAGGALSAADIVATLYTAIMDYDPADAVHRDKFLLSAGHKCLCLYGMLAQLGVVDTAELKTYNQLGTRFPGHPDFTKISGIDFSTGSLGHGLPLGCGFALSAKRLGLPYRTFVLMGDGEQGEGSNWEAAAFAAQNHLDNLTAIIDENTLQINGRTNEICKPTDFEDRYAAFGFAVRSVDGHDVKALYDVLSDTAWTQGKPGMIVAKTRKGKGLSFMEDNVKYHHWNPDAAQAKLAVEEIDAYGKMRGWLQ